MALMKIWEEKRRAWKQQIRRTFQKLLIPTIKPLKNREEVGRYIISLTSYGERIGDNCPYTICSLLNQRIKPNKIVLWIGHQDKEKIPPLLQKLTKKGLEIRFCEDIRSYTKIIYSLEAFPDDIIITADDDVHYPKNWLKRLLAEHKKNPEKIICNRAHGIKTDENHNPLPYNDWHYCIKPSVYFGIEKHSPFSVFPTGVGGILYPPRCLHTDIINKDLFMKLSPFADDIWLWAMAIINEKFAGESPYIVVEKGTSRLGFPYSKLQQNAGNALCHYNVQQNGNDKQIKAVIEHYPKIMETLKKISSAKN